ncbi:hypothetical protein, partial [Streptomyces capoamus]|uniref:hypothetical protein n=1 Tax=Streptomyces capoamus TaxID=68183 RepID=UPI001E4E1282
LAGLIFDDYDAQWRRWREASEEVQAAVTAHAAVANVSRYELEQPVKRPSGTLRATRPPNSRLPAYGWSGQVAGS